MQLAPNEANPWRGIETLRPSPTGTQRRLPRMKLIPGEGLKLDEDRHLVNLGLEAPNEANPWRGIETVLAVAVGLGRGTPNEANPWRGIETRRPVLRVPCAEPPNEANPWRGIETRW